MRNNETKLSYAITLLISTIVLIGTLIIAVVTSLSDPRKLNGIQGTVGGISDQFFTQITPSDCTFSIWFFIFSCQIIWIVYAWSLTCRTSFPLTISPNTLIFYSFGNVCVIIWLYIWGNKLPQFAFLVIVLCGLFFYLALGFQAVTIYKTTAFLKKNKMLKDLYLVNYLVLNGIILYSTWVTYMLFINFAVVLQYVSDVSPSSAGTVSLVLSFLLLVAYFNLENVLLDFLFRHVVIVYPVIIWASYGVFNGQRGPPPNQSRVNLAFTLFYILFAVFLFILRVCLLILFAFQRPVKYPNQNASVNATDAVTGATAVTDNDTTIVNDTDIA